MTQSAQELTDADPYSGNEQRKLKETACRQAFPVGAPTDVGSPIVGLASDSGQDCSLGSPSSRPVLTAHSSGRIVILGSQYGQNMNAYNAESNASSRAMRVLTRTVATEWQRFGIHCNYVEPCADTAEFRAYRDRHLQVIEALLSGTAQGRRGHPKDDVGAVVAMLACDEAKWLNGNLFFADGGQHLAAPVWVPAIDHGFVPGEMSGVDIRVAPRSDGTS